MAFAASSLAALIESNGFTFWRYVTTDTRATVTAAGYFASVAARMRAGDLLLLQTSDAMALLPVRTGPSIGPGTTLDGVVGPLATVRGASFSFTIGQAIATATATVTIAPVAAGIVVGGSVPVSAQVTGAIPSLIFGVLDGTGALMNSEVTAPVTGGSASAILAGLPLGSGYRIRARVPGNAALVASSAAFNIGADLQFLLQETNAHLLLQTGSGLKQN